MNTPSAHSCDKINELLRDEAKFPLNSIQHIDIPYAQRCLSDAKNCLYLQFNGWAIVLNNDGTWRWEATDGG